MGEWEDLRRQTRALENEIDVKLINFNKIGISSHTNTQGIIYEESEPLLSSEDIFEASSNSIEILLDKLSYLNELMTEFEKKGSSTILHTIQRHKEILQDYEAEFRKTKDNYKARKEREQLLQTVRKEIDSHKGGFGLNRRTDLYLKENEHIKSSTKLVDDQISIAVETRDNLMSQRMNMKKLQTRLNDLSSRFPLVNSLVQRIHLRKRRDSVIIGLLVSALTIILLYIQMKY